MLNLIYYFVKMRENYVSNSDLMTYFRNEYKKDYEAAYRYYRDTGDFNYHS